MAFLSQKITYGAACAKLGLRTSPHKNEHGDPIVEDGKLALGNLNSDRDWGYAGDTVRAIWLTLQQSKAEDFAIGTGISHSVRDMCRVSYGIVGYDWQDHVVTNERFLRPVDSPGVIANIAKAKGKLGWTPTTAFEDMLADMIRAHIERLQNC